MAEDRRSVAVDKQPSVLHNLRVGKNMDLGARMWDRGPGPAVLASAAAVTLLAGIITNILVNNNGQGSSASFTTTLAAGIGILVVAISNVIAGKVSRRQSFEERLRLHEAAAISRISALLSSAVEHQRLRLPTIDLSIEVRQSSGIGDVADLDVSPTGEGLALESSALITLLAEHPRCTIILGGPGSGKTTVLLELANRVIRSRQPGQSSYVPLFLSCRTWDNSAFPSWLDDQARSSFGVAGPVLRSWTNKGTLLLLLDGIDEVKPGLQKSFVSALNAWLSSSVGGKTVVTCRTTEYFSFAQKVWHDQLAIMQPLTSKQVRTYLQRLSENSQVAAIRTGLRELSNSLTHQLDLGEEWRSPRLVRMVAEALSLEQLDDQS